MRMQTGILHKYKYSCHINHVTTFSWKLLTETFKPVDRHKSQEVQPQDYLKKYIHKDGPASYFSPQSCIVHYSCYRCGLQLLALEHMQLTAAYFFFFKYLDTFMLHMFVYMGTQHIIHIHSYPTHMQDSRAPAWKSNLA